MKLVLSLLTALFVATPAFADHALENARYIAQLSYTAADDAESLQHTAYREAGWIGRDLDRPAPRDHREDNLLALAQAARDLHFALSDLYRVSYYAMGPVPPDHRGDNIRAEFERARRENQRLRYAYYELSAYSLSYRLQQLYTNAQNSMESLAWYVYGANEPGT